MSRKNLEDLFTMNEAKTKSGLLSQNSWDMNPVWSILFIYFSCAIVKVVEFLWLRTDQTILADNFINKLLGIAVLVIAMRKFSYSWDQLGFLAPKFIRYSLWGLALGAATFLIAYAVEFQILGMGGETPKFELYAGGFSLTGDAIKNTALSFLGLCFIFNVINVVMEEGLFRGLFLNLAGEKYGFAVSNLIVAFFFGVWHIITPLRSYLDGDMSGSVMIPMSVGYIILSGLMSVKWGLLRNISGVIWVGMAEHFFNNTIVNVLHIVSTKGVDELQIVRILIAQTLSIAIVLAIHFNKLKPPFPCLFLFVERWWRRLSNRI